MARVPRLIGPGPHQVHWVLFFVGLGPHRVPRFIGPGPHWVLRVPRFIGPGPHRVHQVLFFVGPGPIPRLPYIILIRPGGGGAECLEAESRGVLVSLTYSVVVRTSLQMGSLRGALIQAFCALLGRSCVPEAYQWHTSGIPVAYPVAYPS